MRTLGGAKYWWSPAQLGKLFTTVVIGRCSLGIENCKPLTFRTISLRGFAFLLVLYSNPHLSTRTYILEITSLLSTVNYCEDGAFLLEQGLFP